MKIKRLIITEISNGFIIYRLEREDGTYFPEEANSIGLSIGMPHSFGKMTLEDKVSLAKSIAKFALSVHIVANKGIDNFSGLDEVEKNINAVVYEPITANAS